MFSGTLCIVITLELVELICTLDTQNILANLHTRYAEYTGEFKQKKYRNKSKKIPTQLLMVRLYKIYLLVYHSSSFNPSERSQFQKY